MATGAVGTNGAHAQKVVVSVRKIEQGFATAHCQLVLVQIARLMAQLTQQLECATIQAAQVRKEIQLLDMCKVIHLSLALNCKWLHVQYFIN